MAAIVCHSTCFSKQDVSKNYYAVVANNGMQPHSWFSYWQSNMKCQISKWKRKQYIPLLFKAASTFFLMFKNNRILHNVM